VITPQRVTPGITLIVAVADSGVIGRDNTLPWHLPDDLKRFKRLTMGKPMVMGRKTFESIGKPLPGRQNIVVTRDANYRREGITVVHDLDAAVRAAGGAPEIMIIGGAELFRLSLPRAGRIHLTRVHGDIAGDVMWPALDSREWHVVESERHDADERHAYAMTFELWEKRTESTKFVGVGDSAR
jgi:dihydrofolate reductase